MNPELFAAHKAFEMVKHGSSFRDAYIKIGANLNKIKVDKSDIAKMLKESKHHGGVQGICNWEK